MNLGKEYYPVSHYILASANIYFISTLFLCPMHCTFYWVLSDCTFYVSLLCYWSHLKASATRNATNQLCCFKSAVVRSNVQFATAENEKKYILSNMICIKFQSCQNIYFWSCNIYSGLESTVWGSLRCIMFLIKI